MTGRPAHLLLSALGWLGFLVVMAWTSDFLADVVVPRTVDGPVRTGTAAAVAVDLGLLLLFAVQHSGMARRSVKAWLARAWPGRHVPPTLERTTFVVATDLCLVLLLLLWQPFGGPVWHVDGPAAVALWVLFASGWLLAVAATFAVDHLDLLGLRQAGWGRGPRPGDDRDDGGDDNGLKVHGLYAVVRHPLMTGLLLAFWATPRMGASHLLFALAATGYVAVGIAFEERDLRRTFGPAYDDYARRVPALVPRLPRRRRSVASV